MDFGLARSVGEGLDASAIAGTPAYMAPEQITAKGIGPRADVFSLGVSLYEMLTGTLPFKGFDRATAPLRPSEIVPTVPSAVDDIVLRAMSTDPDARFGSAQELGERIRAILDQVDSDALDR
jgi:serine/threonine-protein kinase